MQLQCPTKGIAMQCPYRIIRDYGAAAPLEQRLKLIKGIVTNVDFVMLVLTFNMHVQLKGMAFC